MNIPKRFQLYGQTIEVVEKPDLLHTDDCRGMAKYRDSRIELQSSSKDNPMPAAQVEQVFCHELVHFLFHMAGYTDDRGDEVKVERISNLLHQALSTAEYDTPERTLA